MIKNKITPCLWFENQAEEAVNFYISLFPESKVENISYYGKEGFEIHGMKEGTVMTINFSLKGQPFIALNGGPFFKFNESISFQVFCDDQEEIDHYWYNLTEGGMESQCGWLKDRFGLSWQIIPSFLGQLMSDPSKSEKAIKAMMQMKKFEIDKLI